MGKIKEIAIAKSEEEEIKSIIKKDDRYRVRNRANTILYKCRKYKVKETKNINAEKVRGGRFISADHIRLIIDDNGENATVMPIITAASVRTGSESVAV